MNTGLPRSFVSESCFPSSVMPAIAGAGRLFASGVAVAEATRASASIVTATKRMCLG